MKVLKMLWRPVAKVCGVAVFLAVIGFVHKSHAEDAKPLTVEQCIDILGGLNSLNCVGQQLNEKCSASDAKQYKLGPARLTIGLNISALSPVKTAAQNAQTGFMRELPPLPSAEPNKPNAAERDDAAAALNKKMIANWQKIIQKPCNVTLAHLKASELKIGDGPDENAIPPAVLGAIWPIIDQNKP